MMILSFAIICFIFSINTFILFFIYILLNVFYICTHKLNIYFKDRISKSISLENYKNGLNYLFFKTT